MPKAKTFSFSDLSDAVANGERAVIAEQIRNGIELNARNDSGETLLSFSAAWNQLEIAELLLKAGADPNVADKTGGTALMLAAQHAGLALVKLLLKYNADRHAADQAGHTVVIHAGWRDDDLGPQIKRLLSTAGRRKRSVAV